jgi:hypothetical protein
MTRRVAPVGPGRGTPEFGSGTLDSIITICFAMCFCISPDLNGYMVTKTLEPSNLTVVTSAEDNKQARLAPSVTDCRRSRSLKPRLH